MDIVELVYQLREDAVHYLFTGGDRYAHHRLKEAARTIEAQEEKIKNLEEMVDLLND